MMSEQEKYMMRCMDLAMRAQGNTAPNPMVGAVLVYKGRMIGEGYHERYGGPHAEVNCINNVKEEDVHLIKESTIYVNLEPCSHYGKTPPCADLIIAKKIKKVVVGSYDPNPLVAGNGIKKLKEAGVEVIERVLEKECDFFNRRFMSFFKKQRPYIILKWAQSADGFFAPDNGRQFWLTNEYSKRLVHKWRTEEDAILVGTNTALADDPQLTARLWEGKNPIRLLIDMDLKVPRESKIFDDEAMTIVYNRHRNELDGGIVYVQLDTMGDRPQAHDKCREIIEDLYKRSIQSIIIEGGANTLNQFIHEGLWDEARIFTSAKLLHNGIKAPILNGTTVSEEKLADDSLLIKVNAQL